MTDEETILWLAIGAAVFLFLASTKKPTGGGSGGSGSGLPGSGGPGGSGTTTGPSWQWTPPFFPPAPGEPAGQPVCMDNAGNVVPANPDGSCPMGSTLTIAVDVTR